MGEVVEREAGWRAERAYPACLYLPDDRDQTGLDTLRRALARYGVPVKRLQANSEHEILAALDPGRTGKQPTAH